MCCSVHMSHVAYNMRKQVIPLNTCQRVTPQVKVSCHDTQSQRVLLQHLPTSNISNITTHLSTSHAKLVNESRHKSKSHIITYKSNNPVATRVDESYHHTHVNESCRNQRVVSSHTSQRVLSQHVSTSNVTPHMSCRSTHAM